MIWVAVRMLLGDRLKYFGLLAGMAFAAMMIAQQASIFSGLKSQTGTFIRDRSNIDLWVMDPQVRFSEDQQSMPETALQRVRSVDGVLWAVPLYKSWLKARLADGTRLQVIVVGLDDATLVGGPAEMVEGDLQDLRRDGAIIINTKDADSKLRLARSGDAPLRIGDRLSLNDQEAVVVGSYRESPSFFWDPLVYTTYSRAKRFAPPERHLLSFIMVRCHAQADVAGVARAIEGVTGYKARTGEEFIDLTSAFILKSTGILINFGIAVGLGFVIGLLVTGQTFFNFTLDNLRHFAALKAMGASSASLVGMVFTQVLVVTLLALGIGLGIAAATGFFIRGSDLAFLMPWQVVAFTGVSMLLVACAAALLSLAKVLRLEPGVVFKG